MAVPATGAKPTETIDTEDSTGSWMPLVAHPVVTFSILADLFEMNFHAFYSILTERELVIQTDFPNYFRFFIFEKIRISLASII